MLEKRPETDKLGPVPSVAPPFKTREVQLLTAILDEFLPKEGALAGLRSALKSLYPLLDRDSEMRGNITKAFDKIKAEWGNDE